MDGEEEVTPDTDVCIQLGSGRLRTLAMLSIRHLAANLKGDLTLDEIDVLVELLLDRDEQDSEPEPEPGDPGEPDEDPGEPDDGGPDDGEPEPGDSEPGEPDGDSDGGDGDSGPDGEPEFDPDGEPDEDGPSFEDSEESEEGEEPEGIEAGPVSGEVEAEPDPDGTWLPGDSVPPKRKQEDYPEDILAALKALGLDPSKL